MLDDFLNLLVDESIISLYPFVEVPPTFNTSQNLFMSCCIFKIKSRGEKSYLTEDLSKPISILFVIISFNFK